MSALAIGQREFGNQWTDQLPQVSPLSVGLSWIRSFGIIWRPRRDTEDFSRRLCRPRDGSGRWYNLGIQLNFCATFAIFCRILNLKMLIFSSGRRR